MMLDIHQIMAGLAERRPIFHSEADFQHALAWRIHETRPDAEVRLEFNPLPDADSRIAVDIWVRLPEATVAVELKYCTRELRQEWQGERFALRNHGAQPPRRYDFVKDVQRLEYVRQIPNPADYGFAVLLTNDSGYWMPPTQADTTDSAFRIHDGHWLNSGELRWGDNTSPGTKRNREEPIKLVNSYQLRWQDYSYLGDQSAQRFRYLAVSVPALSGAPMVDSVRGAVRRAIQQGRVLPTPGRGNPPTGQAEFKVTRIDDIGIAIDKVNINAIITWEEIDGIAPYIVARNGTVEIGATRNGRAKADSLQLYLQQHLNASNRAHLSRASYVAAILKAAGVVCYAQVPNSKAKHIRLLPPFTTWYEGDDRG